ncbi:MULTISPECIES: DUF2971 domain-containing protein [unclassified Pseudomonas]|uniref:DUF2971 domain-containing protein n=1 Tax=unclassified Pseudomonas TaxID=196821 RepID=UPI0015A140C3|nr:MULTISPECIES: DUF2971 domain-containing protein [unclassified Pseudomonas]NWC96107.1 DUF2971 domain-containing protein [Pseudomonas sp. IPO3779]NWD16867.1 DUF2971 domain-containing protein [Pseudomonas sp. IPO3778]
MEVEVLKSLNEDMVLWRYMSLDKFINLLSDQSLYFASLASYKQSDPFEGYPPLVALQAMYSVSDKAYADLYAVLDRVSGAGVKVEELAGEPGQALRKALDNRFSDFRKLTEAVFKGTMVSCWYQSEHQSEAMWKLYSDQLKGVAIRTTVGGLAKSLKESHTTDKKVFIGKIKYLDYGNAELTPQDCVVDGHIVPLLKRISFSHENEVRAFFVGDANYSNIEVFVPESKHVNVEARKLIDAVYISPYSNAPFANAVKAVCKVFGLECSVTQSDLLGGVDQLFDFAK